MRPTRVRRTAAAVMVVLSLLCTRANSVRAASFHADATMQPACAEDGASPSRPDQSLLHLVAGAVRGANGEISTTDLLRRLHAGIRAPGVLSRLPAHEQLVIIDLAGRLIDCADGTPSSVVPEDAIGRRLLHTGERVVLIHTHLRGTGLSLADLGQLTKPAVSAVIVVGHDGSLYSASRGGAISSGMEIGDALSAVKSDRRTSIVTLAKTAQNEVLRLAAKTPTLDEHVFLSHLAHLVSLALAQANAIRYKAILGSGRQASFVRFSEDFARLSDAAGTKVHDTLAARPR